MVPATREAEVEESLEPRRQRLQRVGIAPLHSSLATEQDSQSKKKRNPKTKAQARGGDSAGGEPEPSSAPLWSERPLQDSSTSNVLGTDIPESWVLGASAGSGVRMGQVTAQLWASLCGPLGGH